MTDIILILGTTTSIVGILFALWSIWDTHRRDRV